MKVWLNETITTKVISSISARYKFDFRLVLCHNNAEGKSDGVFKTMGGYVAIFSWSMDQLYLLIFKMEPNQKPDRICWVNFFESSINGHY